MVIPSRRLLLLLLLGIPLSLFPIFHSGVGSSLWLCYLLILSTLLAAEYFLFPGKRKFQCTLEVANVYYLESSDKIVLKITRPGLLPIQAHIFIVTDGPAEIEIPEEPQHLGPGETTLTYKLRPFKRGLVEFPEVRMRLCGYVGFWWFQYHFHFKRPYKTRNIPNIRAVGKYALRFFSDPQVRAGLKVERYRGEGSEFESLREYLPGFDTRTLDWKASARKAKMYCRQFRAERNHEIILALDCGRLMAGEMNGITKLDYAINSLLFIAYCAIKTGDQVGFIAFADKVYKYLKPQSHISTLDKISAECETISYEFKEANFVIGMEYLLSQQKKRALIIVLTDFTDTISAELMKDYVGLIAQRHLVLFVAVRDPFLDENLRSPTETILDLHRHVACYHIKDERVKLFSELKRLGIHCLDLMPNEISIPLVNRYLEIRRREMV